MDVDLQKLMATPVLPWTLTLGELLKLKPELLKGLVQNLITQGELAKGTLDQLAPTLNTVHEQRVGINNVNGIRGKDEGSTTLLVEYGAIVYIAILDNGARISIAIRSIWEKWGKPIVRGTRMKLQLADGSLENPIGLLENITVKSCGIEYE